MKKLKKSISIHCAKNIGFCYGVKRAIDITNKASSSSRKTLYTLGPIIHNPQVVRALERQGVRARRNVTRLKKNDIAIIRSHGITSELEKNIRRRGITVIDATCPFVKRAQLLAGKLERNGYTVAVIGEKNHPEVKGIVSYSGGRIHVIEKLTDITNIRNTAKLGVISQTTQSVLKFNRIVEALARKVKHLKIHNTICLSTQKRQDEAVSIARKVDRMIIIGGKNSANTGRLARLCRKANRRTHHIETADALKGSWFRGARTIGIASGASTPKETVKAVIRRIRQLTGQS